MTKIENDLGDKLPKWSLEKASHILGYSSLNEVPDGKKSELVKYAIEMSEVN